MELFITLLLIRIFKNNVFINYFLRLFLAVFRWVLIFHGILFFFDFALTNFLYTVYKSFFMYCV